MPTPLRRGKILDLSLSAFFLVIFGLVPVILIQTRETRGFQVGKLQTAYVAVIILSWPFFSLGALLLFYFWRKDRSIDKTHFSTATPRQLSVIVLAVISTFIGCLLIFGGILLATINRFQQNVSKFYSVIDIASLVLVAWIAYVMLSTAYEVWRLKQSLQEFSQNQAFPEAQQGQTRQAHEASHATRRDSAEPVYV